MTSALRGREGGWSKRDDSTDRLREWDSESLSVTRGGPKIRKFCGRHLSIAPDYSGSLDYAKDSIIVFIRRIAHPCIS